MSSSQKGKMISFSQDQESRVQNPAFDALFCEEECFNEDLGGGFGFNNSEIGDFDEISKKPLAFLFEHDLFWENDELVRLLSREKTQAHLSIDGIKSDGSLKIMRKEAVKWIAKVIAHYGFNANTAVLAVNYYDRFVTSSSFQKEKPWMSQLAAVACLSIAAKVEETQVPLLLDLQVCCFIDISSFFCLYFRIVIVCENALCGSFYVRNSVVKITVINMFG